MRACFRFLASAGIWISFLGAGTVESAEPKGSPGGISATVSFRDRDSDSFKSDGASYADGVDGVISKVQVTVPSWMPKLDEGQFLLNLTRAKSRKFSYRVPEASPTSCKSSSSVQVAQGNSPGFFTIKGIAKMAVGATLTQRAAFSTPHGVFRFFDPNQNVPNHPHQCSQPVVVTRTSKSTWTVTTDAESTRTYHNLMGALTTPGALTQLNDQGDPRALKGNFSMPFGLTINCPSCQ